MQGSAGSLDDLLRIIAREIAGEEREVAYLLDPSGRVILRREGEVDRVQFGDLARSMFEGLIGVHNHPSGTSLSKQDVRFLLTYRLAELRVVTEVDEYVLPLPPDTDWEDIAPLIESIEQELQIADLVAINTEGADPLERHRTRMHRLWTEIAEIRGWAYRREPHR